jgi:hypothetical protein
MGYELNKLMSLYGVSSPTLPSYTGSTGQDRANYDAYANEYKNRLNTTSMYSQPQYQTSLSPAAPAQRGVLQQPVFQTSATPSLPAPSLPTTPTMPGTGGGYGGVGPIRGIDQSPRYNGENDIMPYNPPSFSEPPVYTPPYLNELPAYNPDLNIMSSPPSFSEPTRYSAPYLNEQLYDLDSGVGPIRGMEQSLPNYVDMNGAYTPDMSTIYNPPSFNEPQVYSPPSFDDTSFNEQLMYSAPSFNEQLMYAPPAQEFQYTPPAMEEMQYAPPAQEFQYSTPSFTEQSFSEPMTYAAPSFSEQPTYEAPSFNEQSVYNPDMNAAYTAPSFDEFPTYTAPSFDDFPTYNPPAYTPSYELPYTVDGNDSSNFMNNDFNSYPGYFNFSEQDQFYKRGGPVKKFAVGGLNDMAEDYGINEGYGINMLPGNEDFQYGPRPKSGPLGSWIQQVGTETVPGVTIAGRARTPERNREVKGVPNSLHITDNAVDFRPPPNMTQSQLLTKLKNEFGADFDVLPSKGRSVHVEPGPGILKGAPPAVAAQVAPAGELGSMTPPPAEGEAVPTSRASELQMMLQGYGDESIYADELASARKKATEEADAFKTMLEASLESPEDAKASKAEMYFRLAAAFGSPTKTGGFGENLGLASKEMADYAKGRRESAQGKLATRMKLQEMRMGAAKEELGTLRALSVEDMKDQRALKQSLIKEYIESGKPQSAAGKQALDEGYKAGTPEFQARVREVSALNVARETAQLDTLIGNLAINQRREEREEKKGEKLTPQELTMKRETEDSLASLTSAMDLISKAYTLNPNTFDTSLLDQGRRKALEIAGAKDPKLVNTRALENLLKNQVITSAAEKMKGVLTDADIALLKDIQGLDAKSVEERAIILRSAYSILKSGQSRMKQRLQDVSSGAYRQISGE